MRISTMNRTSKSPTKAKRRKGPRRGHHSAALRRGLLLLAPRLPSISEIESHRVSTNRQPRCASGTAAAAVASGGGAPGAAASGAPAVACAATADLPDPFRARSRIVAKKKCAHAFGAEPAGGHRPCRRRLFWLYEPFCSSQALCSEDSRSKRSQQGKQGGESRKKGQSCEEERQTKVVGSWCFSGSSSELLIANNFCHYEAMCGLIQTVRQPQFLLGFGSHTPSNSENECWYETRRISGDEEEDKGGGILRKKGNPLLYSPCMGRTWRLLVPT